MPPDTTLTAGTRVSRGGLSRLLTAGLVTGISDGLFSSVLSVFAYGSTVTRLFQGVAATLLGRRALDGGIATAAVGLAMHFCVALAWSAVFLLLVVGSARVRRLRSAPHGAIKTAFLYGPIVWMTMSLVVVPLFVGRSPAITVRWWVQFFGHIPFVALPIVVSIGTGPGEGTNGLS